MSDEESFVILGSCSPGNSLSITENNVQNRFQSLETSQIQKDSIHNKDKYEDEGNLSNATENADSTLKNTQKDDNAKLSVGTQATESVNRELLEAQQESLVNNDTSKSISNETAERNVESSKSTSLQNANMNVSRSTASGGGGTSNGSLAASFIMGEVNADVLKSSIYSQFPSLCSMEQDDITKLENLMSEYIELKSTLTKVNATMRQFYEKTQQWREEMQQTEQRYKQQIQNFQNQMAILRNENLELRREMEERMNEMQLADEFKKKEFEDMVKTVSEKAALVENLREQITELEKQNLTSFEYVPRNEKDTKQNFDYITRSEHQALLSEAKSRASEVYIEFEKQKESYIDEINYLKVNLTAAEELLQQSRRDIDLLKANDIEKSERFDEYETEREKMREEILLLHQQVDVYGKDFQMERSARETLAGEKDELLQDLRAMQRTNQKLIEEQKRYLENLMHSSSENGTNNGDENEVGKVSPPRIVAKPLTQNAFDSNQRQRPIRALPQPSSSSSNRFRCPVCNVSYHSLSVLQSHINSCLDNS